MTIIHIDLRESDFTTNVRAALLFTPTRRIIEDDYIVLPRPLTVEHVGNIVDVEIQPTGASWAWKVEERISGGTTRYVVVPDSPTPVNYEDLVDVDPATLAPVPEPAVATWLDAAASALIDDPVSATSGSVDAKIAPVALIPDPIDEGTYLIGGIEESYKPIGIDLDSLFPPRVETRLAGAYAPMLAPTFRPAEPRLVKRVQACQPGHPWVASSSASGVASFDLNDTTSYLLGTQSARLTTTTDATFPILSATGLPPIDATGCDIRVWLWLESQASIQSIQVQVSHASTFTDRHGFQITDVGGLGSVAQEGRWFSVVLPWSKGAVVGTGATRTAINSIRIVVTRTAGQAVTYRLGAVDFVKQNSAERWPNGVIALGLDDNSATQATLGIPEMDARGIVGTLFPIISGLGNAGSLTLDQLRTYSARGWEVAAHATTGATHSAGMDTMTPSERVAELRALKKWLLDNGFPSDVYAYPNGRRLPEAEADIAQYFHSGRLASGNRAQNTHVTSPIAYMAVNGGTTPTATLNGYVNNVKADRGFLPVLFHDFTTGSGGTSNAVTVSNFTAFLDYAISQGVAFATYGQVFRAAT